MYSLPIQPIFTWKLHYSCIVPCCYLHATARVSEIIFILSLLADPTHTHWLGNPLMYNVRQKMQIPSNYRTIAHNYRPLFMLNGGPRPVDSFCNLIPLAFPLGPRSGAAGWPLYVCANSEWVSFPCTYNHWVAPGCWGVLCLPASPSWLLVGHSRLPRSCCWSYMNGAHLGWSGKRHSNAVLVCLKHV